MGKIRSWYRKFRQKKGFFAQLEKIGVDFFDESGSDFSTEEGIRWLIEKVAFATNSEYSSQLLKVQAQINALYSQINPHFLYNTLEMIRSQALDQGVENVADMAEALSTMFRYNISHPGDMATLSEELENVYNYFRIQQYRFPNRFMLVKLFDETDEKLLNCLIPRLTLQPIVENAIYHGLEEKVGAGSVSIRIFTTGDRIVIRIADDGVGISSSRLESIRRIMELGTSFVYGENGKQNNGIALININQRIQLYYGKEYGVTLSSVENSGAIVEIELPYLEK